MENIRLQTHKLATLQNEIVGKDKILVTRLLVQYYMTYTKLPHTHHMTCIYFEDF